MQITHIEVIPIELSLQAPYRAVYTANQDVNRAAAVFIRIETRQGDVAWGCAAFDPALTGETLARVTEVCRACADRARDLNPLNTAYALAELAELTADTPSALCAFDIAFHDLLGLAAGLPLHRLLGGYRDRLPTSAAVSLGTVPETVEMARDRVRQGFRILKIKGGLDPEADVRRVRAVADALTGIFLRLDADGGYTVQQAIDVARALAGRLEMLEQPISPSSGIEALRQVTVQSDIPILASQSVTGPASALDIAGAKAADGISIKLATCGGLANARLMDSIARAGRLTTMVGSLQEPALLIAAGLAFALSSPAVRYGDLDGHFDLVKDPTHPRFVFENGWLIATDVPGLGCTVEL
ncbi:MAG TPA: enolase C-terminal domain-like protein [Anaerolineae bacterium]|nr:enolase C-terminal domain-like protein [Anaerolineae bacterium]